MIKKVRAIFDGKPFYPEEPVDLQINGHYVLNILHQEKEKRVDNENAEFDSAFDLGSLAVKTGITDLASEHDHYLAGTPKRNSNG